MSDSAPRQILIVDDHPIMRLGLAKLIDAEPDLEVAWEAGTAREALVHLETSTPDLVLVDMTLPDRSGLELIKDIRAAFDGIQCLAISMHDEELYAERVLRAGGRGYVMKEEAPGKLIQAIRRVMDGGVFLSEKMEARIVELFAGGEKGGSPVDRLSDRELEVFRLLGEGFGTVYIEALCCGLPIIGFPPIIEELNETLGMTVGFEFDANNDSSKILAKRIEEAMNSELTKVEYRKKLMDKARRNFSFDTFKDRYIQVYQDLKARFA